MKKYICALAGIALLAACEQKETTVTNPPAEKSDTTIINKEAPPTKTESNTTINETNVTSSPSP